MSSTERELLTHLTHEQLMAWLNGADGSEIHLPTGQSLAQFLATRGAVDPDLSWFTVDGGGGRSSGAAFFLIGGTVGQMDAGALTGGTYSLKGGFWPSPTATAVPIFSDGFESGNLSSWSQAVGTS